MSSRSKRTSLTISAWRRIAIIAEASVKIECNSREQEQLY